jgi:hypothetical protein
MTTIPILRSTTALLSLVATDAQIDERRSRPQATALIGAPPVELGRSLEGAHHGE